MSWRHRVAVGAGGLGVLAYLVALGPFAWAVADSEGSGLFELLATSSAINSALSVMYLLLTLVTLGLVGSATLSPLPRARRYAVAARLTAMLDLACIGGVGYRIFRAEVSFGPGWYLALVAVCGVTAAALVVPSRGGAAEVPAVPAGPATGPYQTPDPYSGGPE